MEFLPYESGVRGERSSKHPLEWRSRCYAPRPFFAFGLPTGLDGHPKSVDWAAGATARQAAGGKTAGSADERVGPARPDPVVQAKGDP
jgi:hypothetical protein